jgi:prepilin-type N-terminal cleavage/methylation domain-containing protein
MQTSKGFTLIELLVVIAIIGILAGMVVVNMASAPNAAKDATIKTYMGQARSTSAISFSTDGNYTNVTSTADYIALLAKINTANGTSTGFTLSTNKDKYCMWAKLNAVAGSWCIDSKGNSNIVLSTSSCGTVASTTCQ